MNQPTFLLLCAYLFLVIIRPQDYTTLNLSELPLIPVVEVLLIISALLAPKPKFRVEFFCLFFLSLWIFLSTALVNMSEAIEYSSAHLLGISIIFYLIYQVASKEVYVDKLLAWFVWMFFAISWHCILQYYDPEHIGWSGKAAFMTSAGYVQPVYVGLFGDPNDMGMSLAISTPLALYLAQKSSSRLVSLAYLVVAGTLAYTITLTNSRGSFIALMVIFAGLFYLRYGLARSAILAFAALPIVAIFQPERMANLVDTSSQDRVYAWYSGLRLFVENPVLGIGYEQFKIRYVRVAHNSWIEIVAELGIVGYLIWCRALFAPFLYLSATWDYIAGDKRRSWRDFNRPVGLTLAYVGALVPMFFLDRAHMITSFFIPAIALAELQRLIDQQRVDPKRLANMSLMIPVISILALLAVYLVIQVLA